LFQAFDIPGGTALNGRVAGKFITFEGGEGAGKSSQIRRLAARLIADGFDVVTTREPGGTPTAEAIREFVLAGFAVELGPRGEAALMAAARADHVERVIRPALAAGTWVLCDRFIDSTRVYQGGPGGAEDSYLDALERLAVGGARPDLTLILDLPVEVGLARMAARHVEAWDMPDRFERDDIAKHQARRQAFLRVAERDPARCVVVDASGEEATVAGAIHGVVSARLMATAD
jgi:dTMP kinase